MIDNVAFQFVGMHLFWWIMWLVFILWIFATPFRIPGQRSRKITPLDILKKRFALGEIDEEEYEKKKNILEKQ